MNVKVQKSELNGIINIPSSKSVAHRMFIASALSDRSTLIKGNFMGEDIWATLNCLKEMGANIERIGEDIKITPINIDNTEKVLNAGESGSTLRFLIPIATALNLNAKFIGSKRLSERPILSLINVLNDNGAKIENKCLPLNINGQLHGGDYIIDSSISSQFITGLLFALPLLNGDSKIILKGNLVSKNYIDITLSVLKLFKIEVKPRDYGYFVKGNQKYISPKNLMVEGDWSNACFFAVAGATCGDIKITNLNLNSLQSDIEILNLLKKANVNIVTNKNYIEIKKSKICPIEFSAKNCPDIVPIMAILLSIANGVSKIKDVERLKIKESDRLKEIIYMLKQFGIKSEYNQKELIVYGDKLKSANVKLPNDHRMAMSGAIAGCIANNDTLLINAECVKKSYPTFFEDLKLVGGKVYVE